MTGTAWTALQPVLKALTPRQAQDYRYRVESWKRLLTMDELPPEALLYLAQCVEQRRHPNNAKLRGIVAQFPPSPRPAA